MQRERERERERVKKKKWITPQLIVLVRNAAQETVLTACKHLVWGSGPLNGGGSGCIKPGIYCPDCSSSNLS